MFEQLLKDKTLLIAAGLIIVGAVFFFSARKGTSATNAALPTATSQ